VTPEEGGRTQLSEILVFEKPFDDTAQDIADLALSSFDQCDGVGMQLVDTDGQSTRVFTDVRSSQFDALQQQLDEGPCVACLRTGELYDLEPITSDERWPSFAPSARGAGLIACLALPLIAKGAVIGAMNLYAWPVVGFTGWDRQGCRSFAAEASISLASARAYSHAQALIVELRARLSLGDDIVHRAHGALMAIENNDLDHATARLLELAEEQETTLEGAAQSVIDSLTDA
jgi:GAF domain-containing protein